jgi:DNA-binding winged helix-turn-helix (wHTH) protein
MPLLPAPRAVANFFRRGPVAFPAEAPVSPTGLEGPYGTDAERTLTVLRRLNARAATGDPAGALLDALREVPGHPAAAVLLTSPERDTFTLATASPGLFVPTGPTPEPEALEGLTAAAIATEQKTPVVIGHGGLPPATLPTWAKERGYIGGMAAPMFNGTLIVGAVYLLKKDIASPPQTDLDLVETLLSFAARLFPADARPDNGTAVGQASGQEPVQRMSVQGAPSALPAHIAAIPPVVNETGRVAVHPTGPVRDSPVPTTTAMFQLPPSPLTSGPPSIAIGPGTPTPTQLNIIAPKLDTPPPGRSQPPQNSRATISVAGLSLDRGRERVEVGGVHIALSSTEFALLYEIAQARGAPVKAEALMRACWQPGEKVTSNALDVAIHRLRKRLGCVPEGKGIVINVAGEGYALRVGPAAESAQPRGALGAAV